ncbi:MAG TPA: TolC family protein [Vicinamibacterales bacterium]|nr:TolC family protein [Vicinamibacterales bacterium]
MMRTFSHWLAAASLAFSLPASAGAQTTVTLAEAMARARTDTPGARAMAAGLAEAGARVEQARAVLLPRIDVTESVQRGDQPVFVFSTLLSQRRFTAANFDVGTLNNPAAETNVRTGVAASQLLYDGGAARYGVRAAELQRDHAALERTQGTQALAFAAARSFVSVLRLEAAERAANAAVAAAESDLERTRRRRDVGLVTDADVLLIEVHLADVRQRSITTGGDLEVARIELAEALGLPLDQAIVLVKPSAPLAPLDVAALVRQALDGRPERQQAELQVRMAENSRQLARSAFLPRVGLEGAWDFNGATWATQRSGWIVGATLHLNVFNGFADRARLNEADQAKTRAAAERERLERRIEVDVRGARARVAAARAREAAGRTALTQARESQRIVRERYEAGLASATDLLRAAEAVFDAEARATAAEMDDILETVALDRAVGRL